MLKMDIGKTSKKNRSSGPRRRENSPKDREAILRLEGRYICPICSTDKKKRTHRILSDGSKRCIGKILGDGRSYRAVEPAFHDTHYTLTQRISVNPDINEDQLSMFSIFHVVCERMPGLWNEISDLFSQSMYGHEGWTYKIKHIKITRNCDYWIHPSVMIQDMEKEINEIEEKAQKKINNLFFRISAEWYPNGLLWRKPMDYVNITDREIHSAISRYVADNDLKHESIFCCKWSNGYVTSAVLEIRHKSILKRLMKNSNQLMCISINPEDSRVSCMEMNSSDSGELHRQYADHNLQERYEWIKSH